MGGCGKAAASLPPAAARPPPQRLRQPCIAALPLCALTHRPAVQHECIPQAILGMDVICQAKSGMGKTAVFVISSLQQIEPVDGEVAVVVLCHTRELAFQICHEYERFTTYMKNVRVGNFFGGLPIKLQREQLKDKDKCPHILVGTPGRIKGVRRCSGLRGVESLQRRMWGPLQMCGLSGPPAGAVLWPPAPPLSSSRP